MNDNGKRDAAGDQNIALLLGELKGQVQALHGDITEMREAATQDRETASESRRRLHEKIDAADKRLVTLESTVHIMGGVVDKQTQRMDRLEPTVEATATTVRTWALRLAAAAVLLGGIGGAVWYGLTNWGVSLWRFLDQFVPK